MDSGAEQTAKMLVVIGRGRGRGRGKGKDNDGKTDAYQPAIQAQVVERAPKLSDGDRTSLMKEAVTLILAARGRHAEADGDFDPNGHVHFMMQETGGGGQQDDDGKPKAKAKKRVQTRKPEKY